MKSTKRFKTVDEYMGSIDSPEVKKRLEVIRSIIRKAAPKAEEVISYNMPAYKLNGVLIYFQAHTNHIGIYPYPSTMKKFKKETKGYKTGPGTIQFQHNEKLPVPLIKKIVEFRVKEKTDIKLGQKKKPRGK